MGGSTELAQLAARMGSAISVSSKLGEDPFAKVKGLIQDMIEKLEKEADADATHKAFCDTELAETNEKKSDKTAEIEKIRAEEKETYASNKADMEQGLKGV